MGEADLSLTVPRLELAAEFLAMLDEFGDAGETSQEAVRERARADISGLLQEWRNEALGVNMAPGKVPQERYWLVRSGREVLGAIHLRPRMEEDLARKIGHIGCVVRPSERCRGHAGLMLRRMLPKARERGLSFVWLTCRKTNAASARAIRRNGGVLEAEFIHPEKDALFERYRIELADGAARPYDAVVFDLFGTLVDNFGQERFAAVLHEIADAIGADADEFVRRWFQRSHFEARATGRLATPAAAIEAVCREMDLAPAADALQHAARMRIEFTRRSLAPRPDAVATLTRLRDAGLKLGLMSVCTGEVPLLWKETPFASLFDVALFSCVAGLLKSDARFYRAALDGLSVPAERCLYVGDAGVDELVGARSAGMHRILICAPHEEAMVMVRREAREWTGPRIASVSEVLRFVEPR